MHVTQHRSVTDPLFLDRLWGLYEDAVVPTAQQALCQELYYRHEFDALLADERNRLWVLHDDDTLVGMAVIATDFSSVRYYSRPYFERHYPDQLAAGKVHFVLWLAIHPNHVASGAIARLARPTLGLEFAEGAVLMFDAPWIHQPEMTGGFAEIMNRLSRMVGSDSEVQQVEVQRYFAIDFGGTSDRPPMQTAATAHEARRG